MNQELANVIKIYSTGTHSELNNYLIGKSKDTLIGILDMQEKDLNMLISGLFPSDMVCR